MFPLEESNATPLGLAFKFTVSVTVLEELEITDKLVPPTFVTYTLPLELATNL